MKDKEEKNQTNRVMKIVSRKQEKNFYWNKTMRATRGDVSGLREEVVGSVHESDNI